MTREQVLERILDPGGPPLNETQQVEFENWLDREPELRSMFEQQQELLAVMDRWESDEPSAGFDRAVYARIEDDLQSRPLWRSLLFRSWKPALAAGLGAAALLLGVALSDRTTSPESPQVAVKSAEADYYQEIERALDDMEMLIDFDAFPQSSEPGRS